MKIGQHVLRGKKRRRPNGQSQLISVTSIIPSVLSRCACGQLTTQHVAIPPGANSIEEANQLVHIDTPRDKWTVIKHTRTYPTDAFGIIEFQGGGFINKAMVSLYKELH